MSDEVPAKLYQVVKMANDIARNVGAGQSEEQTSKAVAAHIRKFWPPSMIKSLVDERQAVEAHLLPAAKLAIDAIALASKSA